MIPLKDLGGLGAAADALLLLPMDYLAQMSLTDTQEVDFISTESNPEV